MSELSSNSPTPADPGALLGALLSNPDLIRNVSSMLGTSGAPSAEQTPPTVQSSPAVPLANGESVSDGISRVLSNPEMMAKLPDVMKMIAPMMQQTQSASGTAVPASVSPSHGGGQDRRGCRNDLLLALKPFLSAERCRAIDMLLGLSRLGDALQKMI